ncbi:7-cyano-7-deazaguanine synthase [Polaromonas sp. JS666]|uniref:7-cyano-7-deazaguanine synthase n=1 Tax=Polaromonas sp. (strain JS666 / ATCC BAA-500) TaxID=296591 RepID=UPI00059D6D6A|nr:7-cyano-7-deazaguanine synthase [Polaromonas sp. JS666]
MTKAIVVFSGGPDSLAAALWAKSKKYDPWLLTFQFKQREQGGEMFASMLLAKTLGFPQEIIDFKSPMHSFEPTVHVLMHAGTTTTADRAQHHRMEFGAGMVMATACTFAVYHQIDDVVWGATKDDVFGGRFEYSQEFADAFANLVSCTTGRPFRIHVPFASKSKHQVLAEFSGKEDLFAMSWSCKVGSSIQCGTCTACVARRVAAQASGVKDATSYHEQNYKSPLSEAQIASLDTLSDEDRAHIFQSEKAPVD